MQMPGQPEMPPTNKKFGQLMFHRLAINEQNKASEEWVYMDPMTMMGQLGMLPKGTPPVRPAMEKGWDGAPIIVVTADNDAEKKNLEVAKAMNDAFNAHKIPDMLALMTDDFVESDQADGQDANGKKEEREGPQDVLHRVLRRQGHHRQLVGGRRLRRRSSARSRARTTTTCPG